MKPSKCLNDRCGLAGLPKGITTELVRTGDHAQGWERVYCSCEAGQSLRKEALSAVNSSLPKLSRLTVSQLRHMYELKAKEQGLGGHFFNKDTMKFFGDSMSNYKVTIDKENRVYVLSRKKPVKNGLCSDHFFCADTFKEARKISQLKK